MFTEEVDKAFTNIYNRSASRALEILQERLGMISYKITKEQVMGDMQPIREAIKVKLPDASKYTLPNIRSSMDTFIAERELFYKTNMDKYINDYFHAINLYKETIKTKEEQLAFNTYENYVEQIRKVKIGVGMGDVYKYCNRFEKEKIIPLLNKQEKIDFLEAKSVYKYVHFKILGEFLGRVLGKLRAELHSELIYHSGIIDIVNNAQKKTICFTNYVETALVAEKYFKENKLHPLVVYGDTNAQLSSILSDFKHNSKINPLIATIQSLATGVTLIEANVCIFLNPPFRSSDYEQASSRVFRIGQDTQVYFYDIVLDTDDIPNLSTRMNEILTWSESQVGMIMGTGDNNGSIGVEGLDDCYIEEKMQIIKKDIFNW